MGARGRSPRPLWFQYQEGRELCELISFFALTGCPLQSQTDSASRAVIPGTESSAAKPGRPPSDAIVLFDGTDLAHWFSVPKKGEMGKPKWKVGNGYMEVVQGTGSLVSKEKFGSVQIHVEWATPAVVRESSQLRGNSGVFLMRRWGCLPVRDCATVPDAILRALTGCGSAQRPSYRTRPRPSRC